MEKDKNKKAGWTKSSGSLNNNLNKNLFAEISCSLFSGKHTTTYKYCFLKSILDNLYNFDSDCSISFDTIGETFTAVYWNMVAVHKMPQMPNYNTGAKCSVEKIIYLIIKQNHHMDYVQFYSLSKNEQYKVIGKITPEFSKYVIGAF